MPLYNNAFHCMEFGVSNCDAKDDVNTKSCDWDRGSMVDKMINVWGEFH